MRKRLVLKEDGSGKFWEIELVGTRQTICYGRIGTLGAVKTTNFIDSEYAQKNADRLVRSKLRKGYVEAEAGEEELQQQARAREKRIKDEKIRMVAEGNIELVAKSLMEGAGYEYALERNAKTVLLRVKVREHRFVELSLPHRSFLQRVGEVLPTIERVEQLLEECQLPFLLGNRDGCPPWGEVRRGISYIELLTVKLLKAPGMLRLGMALPAIMKGTGHEYSVDLFTRYSMWLHAYKAESDVYPATLHVAMLHRKVLHLLLDYGHLSDYRKHIVPTIELIAQAMEVASLDFKLLSTRSSEYGTVVWEKG
ncbi:MAG: hypothetical protein CSA97_05590 [Bacteroidetes bacterium]|nr:MAG: hypothetical protein CSA97_05590 [Bacteroidota bacterium]